MIGVDFGASYTDFVFFHKGKLKAYAMPSERFSMKFLEKLLKREDGVALTGGVAVVKKRNKGLAKLGTRMPVHEVAEIEAIAEGARVLAGKKKMLVVNVGTGTPIVLVDGKKVRHVIGTGIGGGTLAGLGKLLLGKRVEELEDWADEGRPNLDLTVFDVAGGPVGIVPGDATASNFAKAERRNGKLKKEDLAYSLLNLVAEALGVMAVLAARSTGAKEIVFTGRVVARNRRVRQRLEAVMKLFGGDLRLTVPKNAEYATAIGALKLAEREN